jgi:nitric oxide reductase NorQ protein
MADVLMTDVPVTDFVIEKEPFYAPINDEIEIFEAAWAQRLPVLLKGPTGCGKTRFIEHMSWRLGLGSGRAAWPLVAVNCHEDMSAADLLGRYLLQESGTVWLDGPLTMAVRGGALCYLDEIVEARKDTTVVIHSLTDYRRYLPVERLGAVIRAHENFLLAISYNPQYQSSLKELKRSTRQRFTAIEFGYPSVAKEFSIVEREGDVDADMAERLAVLGAKLRQAQDEAGIDPPSTRLLVYAARLISNGVAARRACMTAVVHAITDDPVSAEAAAAMVSAIFPGGD